MYSKQSINPFNYPNNKINRINPMPNQNILLINSMQDKRKVIKSNRITPNKYTTEIHRKIQPSSDRSKADNKISHYNKHSEHPTNNATIDATSLLKGSFKSSCQEDKKYQSLKKQFQSKQNSAGKIVRPSSVISQHPPHSQFHHTNNSVITHVNNTMVGSDLSFLQQNVELHLSIKILKNYILGLHKQFEVLMKTTVKKKDEEIAKLKEDKECLIHINSDLKKKILQMLYVAKVYDNNEINREKLSRELMYQLYKENEYLRKTNVDTMKYNYEFIDMISYQEYNQGTIEGIEHNNQKLGHKRQRTHFNLVNLKEDEEAKKINSQLIISQSEINNTKETIINEGDLLSSTLSEMTTVIKSLKKRTNSSRDIRECLNEEGLSPSESNTSTNSPDVNNIPNSIKQPLYYNRSVGNKDRKLIEFKK